MIKFNEHYSTLYTSKGAWLTGRFQMLRNWYFCLIPGFSGSIWFRFLQFISVAQLCQDFRPTSCFRTNYSSFKWQWLSFNNNFLRVFHLKNAVIILCNSTHVGFLRCIWFKFRTNFWEKWRESIWVTMHIKSSIYISINLWMLQVLNESFKSIFRILKITSSTVFEAKYLVPRHSTFASDIFISRRQFFHISSSCDVAC